MSNYNTYGMQYAQQAFENDRKNFVKNSKIDELEKYVALINYCVAVLNRIKSNKNAYEQKDLINTEIDNLNIYFSKILTKYTDMAHFSWIYDRDPNKIGTDEKKKIAHTAFIYFAQNTINKNLSSVRSLIGNDKCFEDSLIKNSIQEAIDDLDKVDKTLSKQEGYTGINDLKHYINKTKNTLENLKSDISVIKDRWDKIEVDKLNV